MTDIRQAAAPVGANGKEPKQLLHSLQYLRAIAAFMVIYFHAVLQIRVLTGGASFLPLIGDCGVDMFFVLSGFMMWYIIEQTPFGAGEFLLRRIVRIAPLYWTMTIAALLVACMAPNLLRSTAFDPRHALASMLFLPWRNPALAAMDAKEVLVPVLVPGWTLNFEMLFYLLFAITLRMPKPTRLPALGLMLLGVYGVSGLAGSGSPLSFYHRDILFEFLAGASLGALKLERKPLSGAIALGLIIVGIGMLLGIEIVFDTPTPRSLLLGIPALLVLIGTLRAEAGAAVPSWSLLDALGNASFSTYLTHGFVLAGLRVAIARSGLDCETAIFQIGFVLVVFAIAPAIGLATYRKVERPLVRMAGRWLLRRGPQGHPQFA